jgi:hypothetical protein
MGRVSARSYFGAQQAAVSACLAYNENKQPQPPVVSAGQAQTAISGEPAGEGYAAFFMRSPDPQLSVITQSLMLTML